MRPPRRYIFLTENPTLQHVRSIFTLISFVFGKEFANLTHFCLVFVPVGALVLTYPRSGTSICYNTTQRLEATVKPCRKLGPHNNGQNVLNQIPLRIFEQMMYQQHFPSTSQPNPIESIVVKDSRDSIHTLSTVNLWPGQQEEEAGASGVVFYVLEHAQNGFFILNMVRRLGRTEDGVCLYELELTRLRARSETRPCWYSAMYGTSERKTLPLEEFIYHRDILGVKSPIPDQEELWFFVPLS